MSAKVSPATSPFAETPKVDADLLQDDFPATENPEPDHLSSALVQMGSGLGIFNSLLQPDGKIAGWNPSAFNPNSNSFILKYEELLKNSQMQTVVPKRFAAASVLEILRRNRQEFALNTEGGQVRSAAPSLQYLKLLAAGQSASGLPSAYQLADSTKPFSTTMCNTVSVMPYMNPIKWHYMCSTPAVFRACTRKLVGMYQTLKMKEFAKSGATSPDEKMAVLKDIARNDTAYTIEFCKNPKPFIASHPELKDIYPEAGSRIEDFQRFYASQVVNGVNMFDYIMRSPVYAFEFTQQQAVLNAYYGLMKPKSEGAFDPTNQADCEKYREPSGEEKNGKNYCLPETERMTLYYSIGR